MYNVVLPLELNQQLKTLNGFEFRLGYEILRKGPEKVTRMREGFQKYMNDDKKEIVESIGMLGADWRFWNSYSVLDSIRIFSDKNLVHEIDLKAHQKKDYLDVLLASIYLIVKANEEANQPQTQD